MADSSLIFPACCPLLQCIPKLDQPLRTPRRGQVDSQQRHVCSIPANLFDLKTPNMEYSNPFTDFQAESWSRLSSRPHLDNWTEPWISTAMNSQNKVQRLRPDATPSRHESNDSLSSIVSHGSMPGMTDTSDSELSFDEDSQYNISTSQLWDSFWQNVEHQSTKVVPERTPRLPSAPSEGYFTLSVLNHYTQDDYEEEDEDVLTIATSRSEEKSLELPSVPNSACPAPQLNKPLPRPGSSRTHTRTYSIYPKPQPIPPTRQLVLPPRTSSLAAPQPTLTKRPAKNPRVNGILSALKPSKSFQNLRLAKSDADTTPPPLPTCTQSAPASPGFIDPATLSLRPSRSAFNLKCLKSESNKAATQHNPTAPLAPLQRDLPEVPFIRPQIQRFVSVFDVDSDCESDTEGRSGLAKRIAHGLHKKTPSAKRNILPTRRPATADQVAPSDKKKESEQDSKNSAARRRGGSLGRILGLKYRSRE